MDDKFYPKSLAEAKDYVKRAELFLHSMTIKNAHVSALHIHSIATQIEKWSTYEKRIIEGSFIEDLNSLIDILERMVSIIARSISMIHVFRQTLDSQTDIPFRTQLDYLFTNQTDIIQIVRAYRYVLAQFQEE